MPVLPLRRSRAAPVLYTIYLESPVRPTSVKLFATFDTLSSIDYTQVYPRCHPPTHATRATYATHATHATHAPHATHPTSTYNTYNICMYVCMYIYIYLQYTYMYTYIHTYGWFS
jgi:hypothetical protein